MYTHTSTRQHLITSTTQPTEHSPHNVTRMMWWGGALRAVNQCPHLPASVSVPSSCAFPSQTSTCRSLSLWMPSDKPIAPIASLTNTIPAQQHTCRPASAWVCICIDKCTYVHRIHNVESEQNYCSIHIHTHTYIYCTVLKYIQPSMYEDMHTAQSDTYVCMHCTTVWLTNAYTINKKKHHWL